MALAKGSRHSKNGREDNGQPCIVPLSKGKLVDLACGNLTCEVDVE